MREGWEYKKLNEVCDKGSSNIVINKLIDNNGDFPLYGASGLIKNIDFYHQDKRYIGIVKDGAGVGRVNIYPAFSSLVGTMQYIFPKEGYSLDFIKYFLIKLDLSHCVSGATIPHIYFKDYGKELIPTPSLDTQLAIVSELDKINELIRLKKEQLKDLDKLAQSIFYEMFGDPVENEKGWEVKKLGEVCDIFAGGDKPNDIKTTQDNEYIYPVIANGEGEKGILGYTKKCRVIKNAVTIGARGASIGNCRIVKDGFTPAIRLLTLIPSEKLDCPFLFYIVKGLDYKQNGAGQAQLTVPNIKNESIPLPPLPLQHLFAQRIEQIEHQKSEVQKAITDLETLLASRMQYWFE